MLLGTYEPTLIDKNRLALPVRLRRELEGKKMVLAVGFESCILGFEEKKWAEVTAADLSRPLSDPVGRELRRKMCMNAEVIALDAQGRFVVPEKMMKYAGIKDELTIIGAGDHFEIWDTKRWQTYSEKIEKQNGKVS